MATYLLRRLLGAILVFFGVSLLSFTISRLIPSDPVSLIAPRASAEIKAQIRSELGLDLPVWEQYWRYLQDLQQLDFGESISTRRPVREDLISFLPATIELASVALAIATSLGITLGLLSALYRHRWYGKVSHFTVVLGLSLPDFWLGMLLQIVFFVWLNFLPLGGRLEADAILPPNFTGFLLLDSLLAGRWDIFMSALQHIILPAWVLSLSPTAAIARITKTSLLEVQNQAYVRTAFAKGLSYGQVLRRHILKNALLPVITILGLQVAYALGGALMVELIFAWPGIGRYSAQAISSADYNAIMGVTIISTFAFVFINLCVDLLYTWLDPRIHYRH